ncbi:hypothetical protein NDU88_008037 [Pleurodeles waltl]|uniref:Uncharacterized protein n=1 Tax=Pleurodeles waltl TaxID=8319 RepID=A0AAV7NY65_PLEWA|nr:hypothetical protein NDU88_008037 [Pleurodeles waltl]
MAQGRVEQRNRRGRESWSAEHIEDQTQHRAEPRARAEQRGRGAQHREHPARHRAGQRGPGAAQSRTERTLNKEERAQQRSATDSHEGSIEVHSGGSREAERRCRDRKQQVSSGTVPGPAQFFVLVTGTPRKYQSLAGEPISGSRALCFAEDIPEAAEGVRGSTVLE